LEVGSCVGSVMVKYAGKWFDEVPGKVRKSEDGKRSGGIERSRWKGIVIRSGRCS